MIAGAMVCREAAAALPSGATPAKRLVARRAKDHVFERKDWIVSRENPRGTFRKIVVEEFEAARAGADEALSAICRVVGVNGH